MKHRDCRAARGVPNTGEPIWTSALVGRHFAARDLLVRYPAVSDDWDPRGMMHEKRGENRGATDGDRKRIAFVRQHPGDFAAAESAVE